MRYHINFLDCLHWLKSNLPLVFFAAVLKYDYSDDDLKSDGTEAATGGVLLHKFTGKQLFRSHFFKKVADMKLWHKYFPLNLLKFLRTPFLKKHHRWMILCCSTRMIIPIWIWIRSKQMSLLNWLFFSSRNGLPLDPATCSESCILRNSLFSAPFDHLVLNTHSTKNEVFLKGFL